jgi:molybdenum cofactor biosynthesis enzyme MoaA
MRTCCISDEDIPSADGRPLRIGIDSCADAWNSDYMRSVRDKMLRGEEVEACRLCYAEERLGSQSLRLDSNQEWLGRFEAEVEQRIQQSQQAELRVDRPPMYLDLRPGNLCNLRCRSCTPDKSSLLQREFAEIAGRDSWFRFTVGDGTVDANTGDWSQRPSFRAELREMLPHARKLYFTGGEPTVIDENYSIMKECIDAGYAKDIDLMINTNLVLVPDRFAELLPQFRHTLVNLSIDGYGAVQEYLRFPSKWSAVEKNLRKLLGLARANLQITIDPVFQLSNAISITDLFRFVGTLRSMLLAPIELLPIILHNPQHLDVALLPEEARVLAIERLNLYRTDASALGQLDDKLDTRIDQLIAKLQLPPPGDEEREALLDIFCRFTTKLDASRGQSFLTTFPELSRLMGLGARFARLTDG